MSVPVTSRIPVRIGQTSLQTVRLMLRASGLPATQWPPLLQQHLGHALTGADEPSITCELTDFMRLGEALIQICPAGEDLGLAMGRHCRDTDLGLPGQIARTAPTLADALACLCHYSPLMTQCYRGQPTWSPGRGQPALRLYSIAPYNRYNRFVVDFVLAAWQQAIRDWTGREDLLQRVEMEYEHNSHAPALAQHFTAPVLLGAQTNQLVLIAEAPAQPLITAQAELHGQLRTLGDQLLQKLADSATLTGRVQQWLGPRLQGTSPTLEATASALHMAPWTLRRRLREENSSYQHLLDDLRRDLALAHIRETSHSFGEIAYLLGFSSPGAFQRAFRRWTDETPGDYRRRHQRQLTAATHSSVASS